MSVLFVILAQNYFGFGGIRLDNCAYSAYSSEGEVLLCEGCPVKVLGIEKKNIVNDHPDF